MSQADILRLTPMANALAYKFSRGNNLEEYRSVASLALCEAVSSFDATRGAKVDSWAYTRLCVALRLHRQRARSILSYPDTAKGRASVVEDDQVVEIKEWHLNSEDFDSGLDAGGMFDYAKALLTDQEFKVIYLRFFPDEKPTQAVVAKVLGISSQMVSKIEKVALGKLRGEIFYYG